jgi:hypothetical protein
MNMLKTENFDIGIGEALDLCFFGIMRKIGINNYISTSSTGVWDGIPALFGVPSTPSFVPSMDFEFAAEKNHSNFIGLINSMKPPFTYWERAKNLAQYFLMFNFAENFMYGDTIKVLNEHFGGSFDPRVSFLSMPYRKLEITPLQMPPLNDLVQFYPNLLALTNSIRDL